MRVKKKDIEKQENVMIEEDRSTMVEERIGSLFQPDILLEEDYFGNYRRKIPLEPEKALMLAVLEDGIRAFQENISVQSGKKRALLDEAREWLFSDQDEHIFSFDSICAVLNLDPAYVRRGLKRWEESRDAVSKNTGREKLAERLVA